MSILDLFKWRLWMLCNSLCLKLSSIFPFHIRVMYCTCSHMHAGSASHGLTQYPHHPHANIILYICFQVGISFKHNQAVLGPALYLSAVEHCSWFSQSLPYFQERILRDWPIWLFGYVLYTNCSSYINLLFS